MDKQLSLIIDVLRFPLAIGVVAIHCNHYGFVLSPAFTTAIVPVFIMTSGLLFFNHGGG